MLRFVTDKQRRMRQQQLLQLQLVKRARRASATAHSPATAAAVSHTAPPRRDEAAGTPSLSDTLALPAGDVTAPVRKELLETGRHFSKVAARFAFDNDAASYNAWVIQFKAEAENNALEDTLTDPRVDTPLAALRQKTVYHMILSCVPKAVLASVTSNLREHTAYEAWRTLRCHYIGDEATYLQGLEARFSRAMWLDSEEFPAFEIRFNQVVAELEAAGQVKSDHVKKSVFLHAIESSSKKDARGLHVFDRLNTTSQIHFKAPFTEWMVYMRVEAQRIHEAVVAHRGVKRARENHTADTPHGESIPVSFATPVAAHSGATSSQDAPPRRPPPIHAQRRGQIVSLCNDFRRGSCRFGARCKFSHDTGAANAGHSGPPPKSNETCINFRRGRCTRGDMCRYVHGDPVAAKEWEPSAQHLLRHISSSGAVTLENADC